MNTPWAVCPVYYDVESFFALRTDVAAQVARLDTGNVAAFRGALTKRVLFHPYVDLPYRRGFPRSTEKMIWSTLRRAGAYRLILCTENAWLLHPNWKPPEYPGLVPSILERVAANQVPDAQLGKSEPQLEAWQAFVGR